MGLKIVGYAADSILQVLVAFSEHFD